MAGVTAIWPAAQAYSPAHHSANISCSRRVRTSS